MKAREETGAREDVSKYEIGSATHEGETGKNNEDRYMAELVTPPEGSEGPPFWVLMVADGIGGHNAGEVAADVAIQTVREYMHESISRHYTRNLQKAIEAADRAIYERAVSDPAYQNMGSTAVTAIIADDRLYLAYVGDSRAYLIRDGRIQQMSVDHTWAQEAIDAKRLTPEEARAHPNRHVLKRFLGIRSEVQVDTRLHLSGTEDNEQAERNQGVALQAGDTLLLCSDGLTDELQDEEIRAAVLKYAPQQAAEQLVKMARARGGHDNITVVIARAPGGPRLPVTANGRTLALAGGGLVFLAVVGVAAWMLTRPQVGIGATVTPTTTVTALASEVIPGPSRTPRPTATDMAAPTPPGPTAIVNTPTPVPATDTPTATDTRPPTATPSQTLTPPPTETPPSTVKPLKSPHPTQPPATLPP